MSRKLAALLPSPLALGAAIAIYATSMAACADSLWDSMVWDVDVWAIEDSDGDGVADNADNCPSTPNADQADLDNDGLGNLCDDDADNDGLTLQQETAIGTDPLNPDTDGDRINDGQEYALGRNPLLDEGRVLNSGIIQLLLNE